VPETTVDVSVIVAVRNGASTLAQSIDSILSQQGCAVELIIVDAMSDDGTQQIVESYGDRIATYIREPDKGIYDAWNKALCRARGEWCAFLGADDYYFANRSLTTLLVAAETDDGASPTFVYGGLRMVGGMAQRDFLPLPDDPVKYLRRGSMLPHPGSIHRTAVLREIGGFDASYRIAGDLDAVIRMTRHGSTANTSQLVTVFRLGGISNHRATQLVARREVRGIVAREVGYPRMILAEAARAVDRDLGRWAKAVLVLLLGDVRAAQVVARLRGGVRPT
jgi:glycosyltransferase involved in cell wall biosynthesis